MLIYNKKTRLFEWVYLDIGEGEELEERIAPASEAGYIDAAVHL